MFNMTIPWWELVVRGAAVYVFLLILLRITGKRQVGQLAPFDLVLLDVMMPGIDGIETLKRIRSQKSASALPVIMVTAKSESENVVDALELGANDYVTKPVDFAVALARVNTQISRKRAEQQVAQVNDELRKANEDLERRVEERTSRLIDANQRLKVEIADREESQARSQYLAYHDSLTGLGNRRLGDAQPGQRDDNEPLRSRCRHPRRIDAHV